MKIKTVIVGHLETNCYILTKDNQNIIIDPGDHYQKIMDNVDGEIVGILITHSHYDHIGALKDFKDIEVSSFENIKEGSNTIGNFNFEAIFTPGHTNDSVSYLFENSLFCGDFIFQGTIGRTDIGGNNDAMKESLVNIINLDPETIIYPGHGNKTILKNELEQLNYYIKNL